MDFVLWDTLVLNVDALNPENPSEVYFPAGTSAKIVALKGGKVDLLFPDGIKYQHEAKDLPLIFKKKVEGIILTQNHSGVGTPPTGIFSLLPNGADWKKNYIWKVSISLEERGPKHIVCQGCTTELTELDKKNAAGDIYCPNCKTYMVAYDLDSNSPVNDPGATINDIAGF